MFLFSDDLHMRVCFYLAMICTHASMLLFSDDLHMRVCFYLVMICTHASMFLFSDDLYTCKYVFTFLTDTQIAMMGAGSLNV